MSKGNQIETSRLFRSDGKKRKRCFEIVKIEHNKSEIKSSIDVFFHTRFQKQTKKKTFAATRNDKRVLNQKTMKSVCRAPSQVC